MLAVSLAWLSCASLQAQIEQTNRVRTFAPPTTNTQYIIRDSLIHDGIRRTYALFIPPSARTQTTTVPLVIVLHGGGGNGNNAMRMTGFSDKAMQEGFIVAYPDGTGLLGDKLLTWNAHHCCAFAMRHNIDDVGFISQLIDTLVARYNVDPKRVYVTGMSNGALMSNVLGIALSHKIAAIGPVVGTLFEDAPQPKGPVSAIIFNGLLDQHVPYESGFGNKSNMSAWDPTTKRLGVDSQPVFWAKADGCTSPPEVYENSKVKHVVYHCPNGKDVEWYLVKDNGHAWPGGQPGSPRGDIPSRSINATDVMWDFFKRHSL